MVRISTKALKGFFLTPSRLRSFESTEGTEEDFSFAGMGEGSIPANPHTPAGDILLLPWQGHEVWTKLGLLIILDTGYIFVFLCGLCGL